MTPGTVANTAFDLVGGVGQRLQIVAEQLDRVLAFDAGDRLGDVVLQILREVELDAGELGLQLLQHFRWSTCPCPYPRAIRSTRLERREELRIEEAGGVGAVVGPAMLRDDRLDLRESRGSSSASD